MQACHTSPLWCLIGGLLLAWMLTIFGVDRLFVQASHERGFVNATTASYYAWFGSIAFLLGTCWMVRDLVMGCDNSASARGALVYLSPDQLRACQTECSDCTVPNWDK